MLQIAKFTDDKEKKNMTRYWEEHFLNFSYF